MADTTKEIPLSLPGTTDVAPVINEQHPFLDGFPVHAMPRVAAANIYGVHHPGRNDQTRYWQWTGDGTTTKWDEDDIALLAGAHDDGESLAVADLLRVVVVVNGSVLTRVPSQAADPDVPGAGNFTVDEESSKMTLQLGTAPGDGQKVELFVYSAADIEQFGGAQLAINESVQDECLWAMCADAAADIRFSY